MTAPQVPTRPTWPHDPVPPAPHLTENGRCSDCGVSAMPAAGGEMKVCPACYGLLWHRDIEAHERKLAAAIVERAERARLAAANREEARLQRLAIEEAKHAK